MRLCDWQIKNVQLKIYDLAESRIGKLGVMQISKERLLNILAASGSTILHGEVGAWARTV
jgi:hypothetical protein